MPAKAMVPVEKPPREVLCSDPREDCDNDHGMHQDLPEPTIILPMSAHQNPAAHSVGTTPALWPLVARRPLPRIRVISDVQLEFGPYQLPADLDFDILVASSDIGPVQDAVRRLAKCGKPVVYVMGNREYYGRELEGVLPSARAPLECPDRSAVGAHEFTTDREAEAGPSGGCAGLAAPDELVEDRLSSSSGMPTPSSSTVSRTPATPSPSAGTLGIVTSTRPLSRENLPAVRCRPSPRVPVRAARRT
jgi:hypothetical protein